MSLAERAHTRSFTTESLRRSMSQLLPKKPKKLQQFVVALDDNRTIYLPGQRVEGKKNHKNSAN